MNKTTIAVTKESHRLAKHALAITGGDLKEFTSRLIEQESRKILKHAGVVMPDDSQPTRRRAKAA